ncbi:MAG TPA: N-acetylneuraminate synthase [Chitinophagaceae bacterium]|nr:N-acetylneuraminate synthase [Chitinophagaceae bacterium]
MSVIIIAEAGVNHNGDLKLAKQLVDVAVEAGADYVKFQTFKADKLASKSAAKAAYQKQTTDAAESQQEMLRRLELSEEAHLELIAYCKQKGIQFLSTPFDIDSAGLLHSLGITLGKMPSGEITNLPYLRKMAALFRHLIMSTGMADMSEIKAALDVLVKAGMSKEQITILHCNTEYPTPMKDVNLRAMLSIRKETGVSVGYSDHTPGIEVPIAAVALGATVIEKHFTLDKNMEGPDHKASLNPEELINMVKAIRNIEIAMGSETKVPSASETNNIQIVRKSIVAKRSIAKGELFSEENLTVKRPGTGINPMEWDNVIGKAAIRDFEADELIAL